jgi:hypothetical protein
LHRLSGSAGGSSIPLAQHPLTTTATPNPEGCFAAKPASNPC